MLSLVFEKIGVFTSKSFKYPLKKWIKGKIDNSEIKVRGIENLNKIKDKPFIIAANHIKPYDRGLLKLGISPDSFIIRKIVSLHTGKEIALVANYFLEMPIFKTVLEGFTKGFIEGLGSIPVGHGRDSFHRVFLKNTKKIVSEKRPILIYPVGEQHTDFEKNQKIKAGAAYIALKYSLQIVPVYIKGAYEWDRKKQIVYLSFGKSFSAEGITIDQINEKIKKEILELKLQLQN